MEIYPSIPTKIYFFFSADPLRTHNITILDYAKQKRFSKFTSISNIGISSDCYTFNIALFYSYFKSQFMQ